MGFGLISLLICVAIIMYLMSMQTPTIREGAQAQQQAAQISGRDSNGMPAMNSYKAESYPPNGQFKGLRITDVIAGGPMDQYYGLKVGDVVLQIGGNDVTALGEFDMAKAELDQAFQQSQALLVDRGGTQVSLPIGGPKSPLDNIATH
jgi:C-terminal processing protease CtpA/Prc